MIVQSAEFEKSSPDINLCPKPDIPEYAFIGRSNVGKSSLINMLVGQKSLAKTSSTPGKTQLINYFKINGAWYLVDLPGIGYAKVSKEKREKWAKNITDYLVSRQNLLCIFILIDSRLKPQKNDIEFMEWMATKELPFVIVFTKIDKLSTNQKIQNISFYKKYMLETWSELPRQFLTSSEKKVGKEEILSFIFETNKIFKQ